MGFLIGQKVAFENGNHGWVVTKNSATFVCKTWKNQKVELSAEEAQIAINRYNEEFRLIPLSQLNKNADIEFQLQSKEATNSNDSNDNNTNCANANNTSILSSTSTAQSIIMQCELDWMLEKRQLIYNPSQLKIDLSDKEFLHLEQCMNALIKHKLFIKYKCSPAIFGALAWQGITSRWQNFFQFLRELLHNMNVQMESSSTDMEETMTNGNTTSNGGPHQNNDECKTDGSNTNNNSNNNNNNSIVDNGSSDLLNHMPQTQTRTRLNHKHGIEIAVEFPATAANALFEYGRYLGRVMSYRALALTPKELSNIQHLNEIWPTGQLRASANEMAQIIDHCGITKIAVSRLYISKLNKWIGLDPSLSLHDDHQTALCIAQTYLNTMAEKVVYLFKMNVPVIMTIGWTVSDVQSRASLVDAQFAQGLPNDRWFKHNGVWFDRDNERTERQVLYPIPFFKQRCEEIRIFKTRKQIQQEIEPFAVSQQQLKDRSDETEER